MIASLRAWQYFLRIFAGSTLVLSAHIQGDVDFADSIRTRTSIQRTLERCDGHPEFETALANWLERAEPSAPEERQAIRETALRLLEDTTDGQVVLGLGDGLLRHALEDIKRDPALVVETLARALYVDIGKAIKRQKSKATAILVTAYGLGEDGTVTDQKQASFLESFLDFAEPRVAHHIRPSGRRRDGTSAGQAGKRTRKDEPWLASTFQLLPSDGTRTSSVPLPGLVRTSRLSPAGRALSSMLNNPSPALRCTVSRSNSGELRAD